MTDLPVPSGSASSMPPPRTTIKPQSGWLALNLAEIWASRELLYFFVWRDIKVRYKQTTIGVGWAVVQPLVTMIIFSLVFGRLAGLPSDGLPYPVFFYCSLLLWTYFASSLTSASASLVDNQRVISKVYFPRILLPMSSVTSGLLDFAIAFVLLVLMLIFYRITPGVHLLLLPVFVLLAMATALGAGLWLSALNAMYRDVRYAMTFLIQLWMFASPVAYSSQLVPESWRWLYWLNPMTSVIEGFRWAVTGHGQAPSIYVAASVAVAVVLLISGLVYFGKVESAAADMV